MPYFVKRIVSFNSSDVFAFFGTASQLWIIVPILLLVVIWISTFEYFRTYKMNELKKVLKHQPNALKMIFKKYKYLVIALVFIFFIVPTFASIFSRNELNENGIFEYNIFNRITKRVDYAEITRPKMGIVKNSGGRGGVSYNFYYSFSIGDDTYTFTQFRSDESMFTIYKFLKTKYANIQTTGQEYLMDYKKQHKYNEWPDEQKSVFDNWFIKKT